MTRSTASGKSGRSVVGSGKSAVDLHDDDSQRRFGLEGHPSGDHFVQHHAQRILVGGRRQVFARLTLFGTHILRRAEDGVAGQIKRAFHHPRDTKIGQVDIGIFINQHIAGFDVAVQHAVSMGMVEGAGDLVEDAGGISSSGIWPFCWI